MSHKSKFIGNPMEKDDVHDSTHEDEYDEEEDEDEDEEEDEEDSDQWSIEEQIYNCLGPAAGDVISLARAKHSREEARDLIENCLGPGSGDVLSLTNGRIFTDDPGYGSESDEGDAEEGP